MNLGHFRTERKANPYPILLQRYPHQLADSRQQNESKHAIYFWLCTKIRRQ